VSNVHALNGSVFVYVVNGAFDCAASSCPTAGGMWYRADPATPFGRSLVALATAAKLSGRIVYASGDGVCGSGSSAPPAEFLLELDLKG
jgi:hypothetical protein